MSSNLLNISALVPGLMALVAQWIGLLAMRGRKGKGWWLMLVGISLSTLVPVAAIVISLMQEMMVSGGFDLTYSFVFFGLGTLAGGLLFGIGFAMHGFGVNAAAERQAQLESLTASMAEELRILRDGK
ncbi:MAG: hypothetical protein QM755_23200 [Luteolibacter sp.]